MSIARRKILVAIPSYRCEKQLPRVLEGFKNSHELLNLVESIVVIDNRSPDNTAGAGKAAIAEMGLGSKAQVVVNCENYGLGGSHKVALRIAREHGCDLLAIIHGDNQATTEELIDLIRRYDTDPTAAAILGSRFSLASRLRGYSKVRILGNVGLNLIYSFLAFRNTVDLGSGLNLFKVECLEPQKIASLADAFTFNMELLLYLYSKKEKVFFHPITWTEFDQVSNARNFSVGWKALKAVLKWRFWRSRSSVGTRSLDFYRYEKL